MDSTCRVISVDKVIGCCDNAIERRRAAYREKWQKNPDHSEWISMGINSPEALADHMIGNYPGSVMRLRSMCNAAKAAGRTHVPVNLDDISPMADVTDPVDVIYRRRAVREYTTQPVARETVDQLIDAAIQAPSAMNHQPCIFTVVQDRALMSRISVEAKDAMLVSGASAEMRTHFRDVLSNPAFNVFYDAPVLIVISCASNERRAVEDCSLAAQNLMLAACAMGLGSCWIGFAQTYLQSPEGKSALKLDPSVKPVAPIIIGYPKAVSPDVQRKPARVSWIG